MDFFSDTFVSNALLYIGFLLSVFAAISVLIFVRGFLVGARHLISIDGNDENLNPARIRIVWGILLLLFIFVFWEIIRWFANIL
ncbi:MAG: hypothetical protein AAB513_01030 [Patescibacteria group bacterium]